LLITLGDVAGIGPEIVRKAWPEIERLADTRVVGDSRFLPSHIPCLNPSRADLTQIQPGTVSAAAGQAAYDWLCFAIDECLAGRADGIVTCPLHKEGLRQAGVPHPGHTEILAERTGSQSHAMLLFDEQIPLAVAHVTLHQSLQSIFTGLTTEKIHQTILLLQKMVPQLTNSPARIAVAALNPHASDGGLFGDEELHVILPAIRQAQREGIDVIGPVAADALFLPHYLEKVNGIVAMYHDQGHIPMKLLGGRRAINVTAGLPIIRTSVAHGTAYDIVGQDRADPRSLVSAVSIAARMAMARRAESK
jgi:4-hydroxythreonine-4-phosphate dehydrogenase